MPCVTKPCSVIVIVVSSNRAATWLPKHHGVTTVAVRPRTVPTGTQTTAWNIRHHGELFVRLLTLSDPVCQVSVLEMSISVLLDFFSLGFAGL